MAERIRAVLCGCGGISNLWLKALKLRDDIALVGLVDVNEESARKRAAEHGLDARTGTDLVGMIGRTGAEVVFDCTPPECHATVVTAVLEAGCHVLGEKPMADTMENARRMAATAVATGKTYAVIQNRRYAPDIRAVREFIASGAIGRVTTVQSDFFIGAHFDGFRAAMRHVLLLDMAIHTFDAARCVSGADGVSVWASDWNPVGSWYTHGASAVALFEMTDGLRYLYSGSWCSEGCNTSWEGAWRIVGVRGSVVWTGMNEAWAEIVPADSAGFIRKGERVKIEIPPLPAERCGHAGLIGDFVLGIREGRKPPTDCADNIKSLAMVHAAIRSAETGRREAVEPAAAGT